MIDLAVQLAVCSMLRRGLPLVNFLCQYERQDGKNVEPGNVTPSYFQLVISDEITVSTSTSVPYCTVLYRTIPFCTVLHARSRNGGGGDSHTRCILY